MSELLDRLRELNPTALIADGFDDALVGIAERAGMSPVLVYDKARCIATLMSRDKMSLEDANEFFEYNVLASYMGDGTPVFITIERES